MTTPVRTLEHPAHLMALLNILTSHAKPDEPFAWDVEDSATASAMNAAADHLARDAYQWVAEHGGCHDDPAKVPATVLLDSADTARVLFAEVGIPDHLLSTSAWLVSRALRSAVVWLVVTEGYVEARRRILDAVAAMWRLDDTRAVV